MDLKLVRHLWGVDTLKGFSAYLEQWREIGYEVLEASIRRLPDPLAFRALLKGEGFAWIPQVFSNMFTPGGSVEAHLRSLRIQVEECLDASPLLINAHSGSDSWSTGEAEEFFGAALEIESELGVRISHETHRSRYFCNPWNTRKILERYPSLQVTCDFSHWVCVAERLLPDCLDIIRLSAEHCLHLHARVGYEQGPQVPDPRAPEWASHLRSHESWWEIIWTLQLARQIPVTTLTPEFGPPLYMQTTPYTQEPLADVTEVCNWMARRQADRFRAMFPNAQKPTKASLLPTC